MFNKFSKESRIKTNIFMLPIVSIVILSIIVYAVLAIYINNFKEGKIQELKRNLTNTQKEISKERVLELEDEIQRDIVNLNKNTEKMLHTRIEEVSSIIHKIINDNPKKSKQELKKTISQVLSAIRYHGGRGYFYAYEAKTKRITVHPIKKLIGFDMTGYTDKRGFRIFEKMEENIKEGKQSAFIHYFFSKPDQPNEEFEKISYFKYIKELGWVIGTGEYLEDAKKELKEKVLKKIAEKRYGDNEYFWVVDTNNKVLTYPHEAKIKYIEPFVSEFVEKAKLHKNGVFVNYTIKNIDKEKLAYVKYIKDWDFIIGTNVYLQKIKSLITVSKKELEKEAKQLYLSIFFLIGISLLAVSFLSFYLSKQTGKLFQIYKDDLEGKIQKAVDENIKKDKLIQQQSKLASMGEMIGNIAHQWRQPLNALNINIQNLDDDYADGLIDEEFLEEFIAKNRKIIEFMSHTIDDFRNFFRIDKQKKKFSVKSAIEHVLSIQSAVLKNHNISFEIIGDDFEIKSYESELKQVILNITNNAKDAIIEKEIKNGKITIELNKNQIEIKDNAKGIPEKIIERVFEPYFTTKEQGKGTGMGLYMSKIIIETHIKGSLAVKNLEDGACFTIKF